MKNSRGKRPKLNAMTRAVNRWSKYGLTAGRALLDLTYPPTCVLCGAPGLAELDLCAGCLGDLPGIAPSCVCCALPLPEGTPATVLCASCQRAPPAYERCIALFRYQGLVSHLIGELKFRQRLALARLFGHLLAEAVVWQSEGFWPELLVPVPLHPARRRERGYNQSLEMARVVGKVLNIRVDGRLVAKTVATAPQQSLTRAERLDNVRGVFSLCQSLKVRRLAIIDDVMTTGATVNELASVLRTAGAECVQVWAIARTP